MRDESERLPDEVMYDVTQQAMVLSRPLSAHTILAHPLLNKGSAFSEAERRAFGLVGLLPPHVHTIEEQLDRTYENYCRTDDDLERYIFLAALHDRNETLFYRLLQEHVDEMAPIIYTPVVGLACQRWSHIYRRPRGLYLTYPQRDDLETLLRAAPFSDPRVIVVTDGERILGLGDLGIGGMGIPIGKLALYSLCAGIHPATTLPILLDVGTDNPELLLDPLYLGWHHARVRGQEYDDFVETFVRGVQRVFPQALLQWEDFAKGNARRLLDRYRDDLRTFNDDIQGTGAVTLAGLLVATQLAGSPLGDQRAVVLGAGSAATGICEQIVAAMGEEGHSLAAARAAIWLVDTHGLVHTGRTDLDAAKRAFAQPAERLGAWPQPATENYRLDEVVAQVHPTILIGTAAQPGAFSETLVRDMAAHTPRPIIFPLSNPTTQSEATPEQLLQWTEGRALVATGSPFADVTYAGRSIPIGQCNNLFIFPGVGLGVIASDARRVTDGMFLAAARALSQLAPASQDALASLYPAIEDVREVSRAVALAVGQAAQRAGVAPATSPAELERRVGAVMWTPAYTPLRCAYGE